MLVKNHQRVQMGERVDLRRERAFLTAGGTQRAPIVDRLFQLGQCDIHPAIVRAVILAVKRAWKTALQQGKSPAAGIYLIDVIFLGMVVHHEF
ncbi:hypothetical protein D3C72_100370 [compost metagenome]